MNGRDIFHLKGIRLDSPIEPRKPLRMETQHIQGLSIARARQTVLVIDAFLAYQAQGLLLAQIGRNICADPVCIGWQPFGYFCRLTVDNVVDPRWGC